jgi:hypothetical protein
VGFEPTTSARYQLNHPLIAISRVELLIKS